MPGHWLPHMPQLCASVFGSLHTPEHECIGVWQSHAPAAHDVPAGHTTPQLPQFMLSPATRVQTPPHAIIPEVHVAIASRPVPLSVGGPMLASIGVRACAHAMLRSPP